jgi:hypothetical protein
MIKFKDDDLSYLAWPAAHSVDCIFTVQGSADPCYVILHRAGCASFSSATHPPD